MGLIISASLQFVADQFCFAYLNSRFSLSQSVHFFSSLQPLDTHNTKNSPFAGQTEKKKRKIKNLRNRCKGWRLVGGVCSPHQCYGLLRAGRETAGCWRKAGAACRGGREQSSSSSPRLPQLKLSRLAAEDAFVVQQHAAFHRDGLSRGA